MKAMNVERRRAHRSGLLSWASLALMAAAPGALFLAASPAHAEIVQISGTGLVSRCPCDPGEAGSPAIESQGVLMPQVKSRYFAPVSLPNGQSVCSFSLVYRDVNQQESARAYLMRKAFVVGGSATINPITMAAVPTAGGVVDTIRKATDVTISNPVINNAVAFYFVRVDVDNVNIEIVGLQIDVRPTCST